MRHAYIFTALTLLAAAVACEKTPSAGPEPQHVISFRGPATTRAAVAASTDLQFKVVDLLAADGETMPYIDGDVLAYKGAQWGLQNTYAWKKGSHRFFGYTHGASVTPVLSYATGNETVEIAVGNTENRIRLDIGHQGLGDFLYSAVSSQDYDGTVEPEPVALTFQHLLSAVNITISNLTNQTVRILSLRESGFKNAGTATVTYNGTTATPGYGVLAKDGDFFPPRTNLTINSGKVFDLVGSRVLDEGATTGDYVCVWPAKSGDLGTIAFEYQFANDEDNTYTKEISFADQAFNSGEKKHFNLYFSGDELELAVETMPWNYQEHEINFSDGSVTVLNKLVFYTGDTPAPVTGKDAEIRLGQSLEGRFQITNPIGAQWQVVPTDPDHFEIYDITPAAEGHDKWGIIDPTVNSGRVSFKIRTKNVGDTRPEDYTTGFHFYSVSGGDRETLFDEEVLDNYKTVTIKANQL